MIHGEIESIKQNRNGSSTLGVVTSGGRRLSVNSRFYRGAEVGWRNRKPTLAVNTPKDMPSDLEVGNKILFAVSGQEEEQVFLDEDSYYGRSWTTRRRSRKKEIVFWISQKEWDDVWAGSDPETNSETRREELNRAWLEARDHFLGKERNESGFW